MSGRPLPGGCRGLHALKLLKDLAPILEPSFVEMWDTVIPKLTQYLEGGKKIPCTEVTDLTAVTGKVVCSYLAYIVGSFRFSCLLRNIICLNVLTLRKILSADFMYRVGSGRTRVHWLVIALYGIFSLQVQGTLAKQWRSFSLFTLENSDSKDNWKQKTWEDLVLKVMPTKSCSKNFIDDSMSRLPARYSVVVVVFFFHLS